MIVFRYRLDHAPGHGIGRNGERLENPGFHIKGFLRMDVTADALGRDALIVAAIGVQDLGQIGGLAGAELHGVKQPIAGKSKISELRCIFAVVGAAKHDRTCVGNRVLLGERDLDFQGPATQYRDRQRDSEISSV